MRARPPVAIRIPLRPGQEPAALQTLAGLLDDDPLAPGPPVTVALTGGLSRPLREALAPWAPRVHHSQTALPAPAHAESCVAREPTLVLRPGVVAPRGLNARLATIGPALEAPRAVPCVPLPPSTQNHPACFGIHVPDFSTPAAAPSPTAPVGGVLVPAGVPLTVANHPDTLPRCERLALAGHPADAAPERVTTLYDLAGLHAGRPAVVVGNGPSLATLDLAPLRDAVTFALNGAWRLHHTGRLTPTWHLVEDRRVAVEEAAALRALDWAPLILPVDHADVIPRAAGRLHLPVDWSWYAPDDRRPVPGFATRADGPLHAGQTVAYLAVQLAFLMGCDPVVLVGVDLRYRLPPDARIDGRVVTSHGPDPNHADMDGSGGAGPGGYFGPGRTWHLPKPDRMHAALRHAATVFAAHGRHLLFAGPDGTGPGGLARVRYPGFAVDRPRLATRHRHATSSHASAACPSAGINAPKTVGATVGITAAEAPGETLTNATGTRIYSAHR
ncbi:6-hydroxymethylpterin diphosphokinase MptE-like protein [Roseospira marina]|uniref:6-hydroxymethylpterin diphosphokinase MptE-like protein n=1 Tax=Roseospira marina TaxID=140057 RepID=UPI0014788D2C|nr:6-hydroxymethylpterin diphosphokinase MptE-like protein [Roseospira marina]MBB4315262.1 hypothetical protein [Roseospira marina]MBB5088262.1 hypothetical protein [Roseospira marina]